MVVPVSDYRAEIADAAVEEGLDPLLVEALIYQESLARTDAFRYEPAYAKRYVVDNPEYAHLQLRRVAASYGLMQVMYPTACEEGGLGRNEPPEVLFVPEVNLAVGCRVLAKLLAWAAGDPHKALAAYNGGRGNWLAQRPQAYADRVLETYHDLERRT